MFDLNFATLIFNGLTLSLALGLLLIILWHDSNKELNQLFAIFLFAVVLWNVGALLSQASVLVNNNVLFVYLAFSIVELGFASASVSLSVLLSVMTGMYGKRFRLFAFTSLIVVTGFRIREYFFVIEALATTNTSVFDPLTYQYQSSFLPFYMFFDAVTAFLLWRYRRKIRLRSVVVGTSVFLLGQSIAFVNPSIALAAFSTVIGSLGALLISFAITRQEIINPLAERGSQVEAMHQVSVAISRQINIDTVLQEIAEHVVEWLHADAAAIFLRDDQDTGVFELVTACNLPHQLVGMRLPIGQGVVGTVVQTQQTIHLENYTRDWILDADFELARQTFGSTICVPLSYGAEVLGALLVVAGRQGRLFDSQDVYLLELLSTQTAVAISHSDLFQEQRELTRQVEMAHSRLQTVMSSTENPVIAVDRALKLIFANPAALRLLNIQIDDPILQSLEEGTYPTNIRKVLREIKEKGSYSYELSIEGKTYMCHLASLGDRRIEGWVAVLNDITELKELDRLKSEMVRMASHDLKNPLMGAMAYLDLLRDDLAEIETPEIHEEIQTIERQLERMNRIISGILDVERIGNRQFTKRRFSPLELIKNALEELQQFADDHNVDLKLEADSILPDILIDPEPFNRALINLVENAIKFILEDGCVVVKIYEKTGTVVYEVADNGVGIPPETLPYIFDRFFRGEQKGIEHVSGSGLGLSFVKSIVEEHDGTIQVISEVNKGTTFFISIPIASD